MPVQIDSVDLNADLGEGCPWDDVLLDLVSSTSVACGAHAGDAQTARATIELASRRGVVVGAHPGFADRAAFGRREQPVSASQVEELIAMQVDWLKTLAAACGVALRFIKPHGALYNQAQRDPEVALGIIRGAHRFGLPILGQPGSVLASVASRSGVRFVSEGFPDRRYREDGRLVDRSEPGAIIDDPAELEAQALSLAARGIETLCIHGDDPRAVRNAESVRSRLTRGGLLIGSFV
jgi:UPF0271 protein